jgi:hypothetical protein
MQAQLSAYAYAKLTGKTFVYAPIHEAEHFVGNPEQVAEDIEAVNQLFNIGSGEVTLAMAAKAGAAVCGVYDCYMVTDVLWPWGQGHKGNEGFGTSCWEHVSGGIHIYKSMYAPTTEACIKEALVDCTKPELQEGCEHSPCFTSKAFRHLVPSWHNMRLGMPFLRNELRPTC